MIHRNRSFMLTVIMSFQVMTREKGKRGKGHKQPFRIGVLVTPSNGIEIRIPRM